MKTVGNKEVDGYLELHGEVSLPVPTPSQDAGRLYKKDGDNALYWKSNSGNEVAVVAAAGATATSISISIFQPSHGFIAGNGVYFSGGAFHKATATSYNSLAIGIVNAVADGSTFTLTDAGQISLSNTQWLSAIGTSGLVAGAFYYTSATTPGSFTKVAPPIAQTAFIALDGNNGLWQGTISGGIGNGIGTDTRVDVLSGQVSHKIMTILADASGSILSAFGSQPAGKYEVFEAADPLLEATLFYNSTAGNLRVYSTDSRVSTTANTPSDLNIYLNSGVIYLQNKIGSTLNLLIYQKTL